MTGKMTICCVFFLITYSLNAQVKNTSWRGFYNVPDPVDAILAFTNDTVSLSTADGDLLEIMTFRTSSDTLFLKKVTGQSPCDMENEGSYLMNFKENKLFLLPVSDNCDIRRNAFPAEGLAKVE